MAQTVNVNFFSTSEINSAFWSLPLRIQDKYKRALSKDLLFGLKTASTIFQRILSNIIRKQDLSHFEVNFIDDISVFSKTFWEEFPGPKTRINVRQFLWKNNSS